MTDDPQYTDAEIMQAMNAPVMQSIHQQESGGAPHDYQIQPDTFKQYAQPGESYDNPQDHDAVYPRIINDLSQKAGGDPARIAVGYFSGPGNIAPPESPTPYLKDKTDKNGKSVSSYVEDVTGRLPQTATLTQTPASMETQEPDYSGYSDDEILKAANQKPDQPAEPDFSLMGDLKQMGQSVKSGFQDIGDLFHKDTWTGENLQGTPASAKLQTDAAQGNYMGIPRDVIDRLNESLSGNPAGKVMGAVGGIAGAPLAPAVNATSYLLDKVGIPKDITQFGMNVSPLLMKGLDNSRGAAAVDDPLAQKMVDLGIPLKQSQVNGSRFSKTVDSAVKEVPGSGAEAFNQKQLSGFQRAVSHEFGEDSDKITPDVIDSAYTRIGDMYDTALKGKQIPFTAADLQKFADIDDKTSFLDPSHRQIVTKQLDKIIDEATKNGGMIKGETLGAIRSNISGGIRSAPPGAGMLLGELRDHIMDMSGSAAPQLKKANAQYSALKTIQPLAIKAQATGGNISPALLQNQVVKTIGPTEYAKGGSGNLGNLADLARGGQKYLKDTVPDSGTAKRSLLYASALELLGSGVDSLVTGNPTPFLSSAATLGGGALASRLSNMRNINPAAVQSLLKGRPNSYSAIRLHPANIGGVSANQKNEVEERK